MKKSIFILRSAIASLFCLANEGFAQSIPIPPDVVAGICSRPLSLRGMTAEQEAMIVEARNNLCSQSGPVAIDIDMITAARDAMRTTPRAADYSAPSGRYDDGCTGCRHPSDTGFRTLHSWAINGQ